MECIFCSDRLWYKVSSIVLMLAFFSFTSACSHSPAKPTTQDPYAGMPKPKDMQTSAAYPKNTPWWEKPEYEWAILTLLVIGIGIALGGVLVISSGGGGLKAGVSN